VNVIFRSHFTSESDNIALRHAPRVVTAGDREGASAQVCRPLLVVGLVDGK
jgi:hypothetical protein